MRTTKHILWTEMTRLVSEMKADGNRLHLLITIQSMLGLRIGDVLSLRWKDFDGEHLTIKEQKTSKDRRVILNDSLRNAVQSEFKFAFKKNDLIFVNKLGAGSIGIGYVNRQLKKAFKKYEIEADQVSSHIFRKSFAMKVLEDNDYSDKGMFLVMRLLNHTSLNTTLRYLLLDKQEESNAYLNLTI